MKLPFKKVQGLKPNVQSGIRTPVADLGPWTLDFGLSRRRDGVALVITLIMLSIITFMAVTFLVLSQRERSATNGTTDLKIARNANDAAFARVCSELLSKMMSQTNFSASDLIVSTNYINYNGFNNSVTIPNPTNVNYSYEQGGLPYAGGAVELERNIANLLYNPRAPVFVVTNKGTGSNEFRFYLDLNRNGRFDTNGNWPVLSGNASFPYYDTNEQPTATLSNAVRANFVGDPEWIGQLERPMEMHSADNKFIARYAYLVVPASKTLDINYIHNRAKRLTANGEGFLRNQGVGPWEINLAGFLADLNTNAWWNPNPGYTYNTSLFLASSGAAFTNANDVLSYRYGNSGYNSLSPARSLFANNAAPLTSAGIDLYSDGPLMLTTTDNVDSAADTPANPWAGADNTNHYFSQQDLFDVSKIVAPSFRTTMASLGTSNDSYNAYTFYRMLAQLGTDSAPDRNKLNLNYKNTDTNGNIVPGMETNLIAWTPVDFFTNAANRMLGQITNQIGYPLSAANIPLYPTNYYTPAVHRILQLAANIFDASTNQTVPLIGAQTNAFFPSVFRPIFTSKGGNVWISGYQEVTRALPLSFDYWDLARASNNPGPLQGINIYGVPWVIGAKKGMPNFNEFAMETAISVSRKLKLTKPSPGSSSITDVKQMFEVGISNTIATEALNSYLSSYPRGLTLSVSNEVGIGVTNQFGANLIPGGWRTFVPFMPLPTNVPAGTWPPFINQSPYNNSILVPLKSGFVFFTNATYVDTPGPAFFEPNNPADFRSAASNAMPELFLTTTNRVQFSLVDTTVNPHRVVDFVNLENISTIDVSAAIRNQTQCGDPTRDKYTYWCDHQISGGSGYVPGIAMNQGVNYQIGVSAGIPNPLSLQQWSDAGGDPANYSQIQKFQGFLFGNLPADQDTNTMQTPFNPTAYIYQHFSWQANDPLVHYTVGDLIDPARQTVDNAIGSPPLDNIGSLNTRYRPWGGNPLNQSQGDPTIYNVGLKDPGVRQSADWDFMTNKFPTLGWLGRVHRGTPWQTVYMKSPLMATNDWQNWAGDTTIITNGTALSQDSAFSVPVSDYQLFDLFTTAPNENASRGRLDINQTNLAAWSAVLSGVNVVTNSLGGLTGPATLTPAGVYDPSNPAPAVARIWESINATRTSTNRVFPNASFQHLGDVLATPQLTVMSPFLNTNATGGVAGTGLASPGANGINDAIMERIPQQIMSLLTLNQSPRFVIYSFGQTLHPADHSLVIGGAFNGLCTNYQITAESATRAVVRVEGTSDPQYVNGRVDLQGRSYPPRLVVEQFNVLGPD